MGRIKGKLEIRIQRNCIGKRGGSRGFYLWTTGYCEGIVGLNEEKIRNYFPTQEEKGRRLEQLDLFE